MIRLIWSELQPLGWWRHNEMDIYYDRQKILLGNSRGDNWMEDQCRWWHEYQRYEHVVCKNKIKKKIFDI